MKQGGTTANMGGSKKPKYPRAGKCKFCKRDYGMKQQLERHEKQCKVYNHIIEEAL